MMSLPTTFSKNMKRVRSNHGLTQEEASNLIGIKRATLASYEEARAEPSFGILQKITTAYSITNIASLLYDSHFLTTKESCVYDITIIQEEQKYFLNKYARCNGDIRKAVNILLGIK